MVEPNYAYSVCTEEMIIVGVLTLKLEGLRFNLWNQPLTYTTL